MDKYEQNLLQKINELRNAKTPLQRGQYFVLMGILGQYRNEKKRNLK